MIGSRENGNLSIRSEGGENYPPKPHFEEKGRERERGVRVSRVEWSRARVRVRVIPP